MWPGVLPASKQSSALKDKTAIILTFPLSSTTERHPHKSPIVTMDMKLSVTSFFYPNTQALFLSPRGCRLAVTDPVVGWHVPSQQVHWNESAFLISPCWADTTLGAHDSVFTPLCQFDSPGGITAYWYTKNTMHLRLREEKKISEDVYQMCLLYEVRRGSIRFFLTIFAEGIVNIALVHFLHIRRHSIMGMQPCICMLWWNVLIILQFHARSQVSQTFDNESQRKSPTWLKLHLWACLS